MACARGLALVLALAPVGACLPGNPAVDTDCGAAPCGSTDESGSDAGTSEFLGCDDGGPCTLLVVSQVLDDRVEVFASGSDGPTYRGSLSVDLLPNVGDSGIPGDNGGLRLDEPLGVAVADGALHVLLGHHPSRERGSLLSFGAPFFADRGSPDFVATNEYYDGSAFGSGTRRLALEATEPVWLVPVGPDRLVASVFGNSLLVAEDQWTEPGELLIVDRIDAATVGRFSLASLTGGPCIGAFELTILADGGLAVACDGNDVVAFVDGSGIGASTVDREAAELEGIACPLPTQAAPRRIRQLADDGAGGVVVAAATADPGAGTPLLYGVDRECAVTAVPLESDGVAVFGDVTPWIRGGVRRFLLAGGLGARGVHVLRGTAGEPEVCGRLLGLDPALVAVDGGALEPSGLALDAAGTRLAIGAAPPNPGATTPGYGKVLWVELPEPLASACEVEVVVEDLSDGGPGHAPAPLAAEADTWRRGPHILTMIDVTH